MVGFFILAIMVIAAIAIPLSIKSAQKTDESWSAAASRLGLVFKKAGFLQSRRIEGRIDDYPVLVDTYTVQSGKNSRTTYTRFRLNYPSIGLGLKLAEEGFFAGVTKFFGAQDINVGDAGFDQAVLVKGHHPDRVIDFLTAARRMRIQRFFSAHRGATIDDHGITWSTSGLIREPERLVQVVREVVRLGSHLTTDQKDRTLQVALEAQDDGRTEEAIQMLRENREQVSDGNGPIDPDEGMLEGELLYLTDRADEAREVFAQIRTEAPDDPEILEWADGLTDPVGRRGGEEVAGEQPVTDLDQETVCKQLFESGLTSYRITRTFEERFAGKTVQWSGTLRRVDPYTVDLVFDGGPGCRAMIAVHTIASTGYGDQVVTAIVRYPRDSLQVLAAREGETLSFSGELKKIDALMRNIYVQT